MSFKILWENNYLHSVIFFSIENPFKIVLGQHFFKLTTDFQIFGSIF